MDLSAIIEAAQEGKWVVFIGGLITVLVWIYRTFIKTTIPPNALPLVAAVIGVLAYIGTSFASEAVPWYVACWNGLLASGEATLLWSLVGKKVLPSFVDKPEIVGKPDDTEEEKEPSD